MDTVVRDQLKAACEDREASLEAVEAAEPAAFIEMLIAARETDPDLRLNLPGSYPVAAAVMAKFAEARAHVTGAVFDRAWEAVAFNFDVSVWNGAPFEPVLLGSGAVLIRNHHRVLGLGDYPSAILKIRPQALRADLRRLFARIGRRGEELTFCLHRLDDRTMVRLAGPPARLSTTGQSLVFIGHEAPVEALKAFPRGLVRRIQEGSRSGHVVLRPFGDHVFLYQLHRYSDDLDVLLEEYAETRFEEADTGEPLGVEITSSIRTLQARFSERTRDYLGQWDFPFPDDDDVMSFYVAQKTTAPGWGSYAGRKAADASSLTAMFADRADRPVSYADSGSEPGSSYSRLKERLWALSAREGHDVFTLELPLFALAPTQEAIARLSARGLLSQLAPLVPFVRRFSLMRAGEEAGERIWSLSGYLRRSGAVSAYASAMAQAREELADAYPEAGPEERAELLAGQLSDDAGQRLLILCRRLRGKGPIDFNGLHEAMRRLSADLNTSLTWRFARFGLVQAYDRGDIDTGNQALFCLPDAPAAGEGEDTAPDTEEPEAPEDRQEDASAGSSEEAPPADPARG